MILFSTLAIVFTIVFDIVKIQCNSKKSVNCGKQGLIFLLDNRYLNLK